MSEILAALIGVLVGFALTAGLDLWHTWNRNKGVRRLVQLEIDQNLKLLDAFWRGVTALPQPVAQSGPVYEHDELEFIRRRRLVETALPPLSRLMWESQAGFLADAIPDAAVLTRTYELYQRLNEFGIVRDNFSDALHGTVAGRQLQSTFDRWTQDNKFDAQQGVPRSMEMSSPGLAKSVREFNQRTFTQFAECEGIVNGLRMQGNPLK